MNLHKSLIESQKIELRPDLELHKQENGEIKIKDPATNQFFVVGAREAIILELLPTHSPKEIVEQTEFTQEEMLGLLSHLKGYRLLTGSHPDQNLKRLNKGFREFLTFRKTFLKPEKLIDKFAFLAQFMSSWIGIVIQVVLMVLALFAFQQHNLAFIRYGWPVLFGSWLLSLAFFVISLFFTLVLHEIAHSVVLRRFGGKVNEIGFCMVYLMPSFYSDLTDVHLLKKRRQKALVMIAGPLTQGLLGCLGFIGWANAIPHSLTADLFYIYSFACFSSLFINLNPFLKLDGYYILEFWTGIDNLRTKAWEHIFSPFREQHKDHKGHIEPTSREKLIYWLYAPISVGYSILMFVFIFSFYFSSIILPSPILFIAIFSVLLVCYLFSQLLVPRRGLKQS